MRVLILSIWLLLAQNVTQINLLTQAHNQNGVVVASFNQLYNGALVCSSVTKTTTYTCSMPYFPMESYTNTVFLLFVDTTCITSCTLNIDNVGTVQVTLAGNSPNGALVAGSPRWAFYNGTVFLLI